MVLQPSPFQKHKFNVQKNILQVMNARLSSYLKGRHNQFNSLESILGILVTAEEQGVGMQYAIELFP